MSARASHGGPIRRTREKKMLRSSEWQGMWACAQCGRAGTRNRHGNLRVPTWSSHLGAARNGSARQFVLIQSPTDIVRARWKQISISKAAASRGVSSAAHRFRREHSREMEYPNNPSTAPEPAVPFEVVAVDYCHQGSLVVFLHVSTIKHHAFNCYCPNPIAPFPNRCE